MIYSNNLQLNVHYNKLMNELKMQESNDHGISLFRTKDVCASTSRAINLIKDMFTPPDRASNSQSSVQSLDLGAKTGAIGLKSDSERPGHLYFGDIDSDGYPDMMTTMTLKNGKSQVFSLMNRPCTAELCTQKAFAAKRRTF